MEQNHTRKVEKKKRKNQNISFLLRTKKKTPPPTTQRSNNFDVNFPAGRDNKNDEMGSKRGEKSDAPSHTMEANTNKTITLQRG